MKRGGVENLEWSNLERPIFRNFKITNIKIEFSHSIILFTNLFYVIYLFFKLLEHSEYLIIFSNFINFVNFWISETLSFFK